MPRGGKRPGAGRKKGEPNARTRDREAAVTAAARALEGLLPDAFTGDAHTFLMAVYKDTSKPIKDRLAAAIAAIGYEKPKLAAVEVQAEVDATVAVSRIELVAVEPSHVNGEAGECLKAL